MSGACRWRRRAVVVCTLAAMAWSPDLPAHPPEAAPEAAEAGELDRIRTDLAELRFEQALAAIEAFLADPLLDEDRRVEALVLRVQAHVAYGDLDATEQDYRELLRLRPAYRPDTNLIPPKAVARFDKARKDLVGTIALTLRPAKARVLVDGREVVLDSEGNLAVLQGTRSLRFELEGFDALTREVEVAGVDPVPLDVQLIPNARTIVLRTDPAGVVVTMDGRFVGETALPESAPAGSRTYAELRLDNVPLGDHAFEFSKTCYRTALYRDLLTVDLTDYSPKIYQPVLLEPARARLAPRGMPPGTRLIVDDRELGTLPLDSVELCPGPRTVELRAGGRLVWHSTERLTEDETLSLAVAGRPNAVLVGIERWPTALDELAGRVSTLGRVSLPAGADPTQAGLWEQLELPVDTDLAVTLVPSDVEGAPPRIWLYSPWLREVTEIVGGDANWTPPTWEVAAVGAWFVESPARQAVLVASVRDTGPAQQSGLAPGMRVLAVEGRPVTGSADLRAAISSARPGGAIRLELRKAGGQTSAVELKTAPSPRLFTRDQQEDWLTPWLAAWAAVHAVATEGTTAATARANLALLLGDAGRDELALDMWRRVRWPERSGLGPGTVGYYTGRLLKRLGRDRDAIEAFRRAGRTAATTSSDDGPAVAPAARDHLADLGISSAPTR